MTAAQSTALGMLTLALGMALLVVLAARSDRKGQR